MATQSTLGILVHINTQGLAELKSISASLDAMSQSAEKADKSTTDANQAVSNLVDGIRQANEVVASFVKVLDAVEVSATNAFVSAQNAITDLNIVMGRTPWLVPKDQVTTPMREARAALDAEFTKIEARIDQLAKTTEFSYAEVGKLFGQLKQSGLGAQTIISPIGGATKSILEQALALTSASRGALTLAESGKLLVLSANSLGGGLGQVASNADRMIRLINTADVSFEDLKIMMESLGGAGEMLFKQTGSGGMLATLGALKTAGRPAAIAANDILGMGRAVNNLISVMDVMQARLDDESYITQMKANKRPSSRATVKGYALHELGITRKDFVDDTGQVRPLLEMAQRLRDAKDRVLTDHRKYIETLRESALDSPERMKAVQQFERYMNKYAPREDGKGKSKGFDPARAEALIYKALGTQQAVGLIKSMEILETRLKQAGIKGVSTIQQYAEYLKKTEDEALRAQKLVLESNWGQTMLLESAMFALQKRIGLVTGEYDTFSKKTKRIYVATLEEALTSSDALNGSVGALILTFKGIGTGAGVFASIATAVIGLSQIKTSLETAMATSGTSGGLVGLVMGQSKDLLMAISPLLKFAGILSALVVTFVYLKEADFSSLGAFGDLFIGFKDSAKTLLESFKIFTGGVIPALLGASKSTAEYVQTLSVPIQNMILAFEAFGLFVRTTFKGALIGIGLGIASVVMPALRGLAWALDLVFGTLGDFIVAFGMAIGAIETFNATTGEAKTSTSSLSIIYQSLIGVMGYFFGVMLGVIAIQKTWTAVTWFASVTAQVFTQSTKLVTGALKVMRLGYYYTAAGATSLSWAIGLMNLQFWGFIAIALLVAWGVSALITRFREMAKTGNITGMQIFAFSVAIFGLIGLLVYLGKVMGVFATVQKIYQAMTVASAIVAGAFNIALSPVLLTFLAIVAVIGILVGAFILLRKYMGGATSDASSDTDEAASLLDSAMDKVNTAQAKFMPKTPAIPQQQQAEVQVDPDAQAKLDKMFADMKGGNIGLGDMPNMPKGMTMPDGATSFGKSGGGFGSKTVTINVTDSTGTLAIDPVASKRLARALAPALMQVFRENGVVSAT